MQRTMIAALLLAISATLAGCGGNETSPLIDPNKLPPIDANAAATAQGEVDAVSDAERAEAAKTPSAKGKR